MRARGLLLLSGIAFLFFRGEGGGGAEGGGGVLLLLFGGAFVTMRGVGT